MKKTISLFILVIFVAGLLVGCGNLGNSSINGGGNDTASGGGSESSGENGTTSGGSSESGGENGTASGSGSESDGENGTASGSGSENSGENGTASGDGSENSGGNGTASGDGSESGGENSTASGGSSESGGENGENSSNSPTDEEIPVGTGVGDRFGSIPLEREGGGTVSPDDYRGKIVIVNIWATWCPPCKAELPDFDRIATEYEDELVIIAAHDYSGRANAPAYIEENFPSSKIIFAYDSYYGDAFFAAGGTKYVPRTAILDQNGVIVYAQDGMMTYEQLVSIIEGLL